MKRKSMVFLLLMAVGCNTIPAPTQEERDSAYYGPNPGSNEVMLDMVKEYCKF